MGSLESASNWLEEMRHRHNTVPIQYQRGEDSIQISATIGRTTFMVDNGSGILEESESRDFLVRASDLDVGGISTPPRRGDKIHEARDGVVFTYEVMSPNGEAPFRYSDAYRKTLRIHTKQVSKENET